MLDFMNHSGKFLRVIQVAQVFLVCVECGFRWWHLHPWCIGRHNESMSAVESFWALLGVPAKSAPGRRRRPVQALPETESVRKIMDAVQELEPIEARYLAAFAYMLSRVANVEHGTSPEESRAIVQILREKANLTESQAALVAEIARHQSDLFGSTENFLVGREFDKIATRDQKIALLHCLFTVSAADRSISSTEDHEIRKITREIKPDHEDYIGVRIEYQEHLEVLKGLPGKKGPDKA